MKVTGVVLICLGIIGAAFCGISNMSWKSHTQDSGAEQADKGRAPNMTVPLIGSAAAVVVGIAILVYGGRGYSISYRRTSHSDPARVKNAVPPDTHFPDGRLPR